MNLQGDIFDQPAEDGFIPFEKLLAWSREKATRCECCGRTLKVYKFKLGSYVRTLIWIYTQRAHRDHWLHISKCPVPEMWNGGGDYGKLEWWELLENKPNKDDPSKRSSGLWRLTDLGERFVRCEVKVPSHVFYEPPSRVLGWHRDRVSILDALPRHFNYQALMRGEW